MNSGINENVWDEHSRSLIYQGMFDCMGCSLCQFESSVKFMNMDWKLYSGNWRLPSKITGKRKSVFLEIWRDMGREVKVILLRVNILLYHLYDSFHDEVGRETDWRVCSWRIFLYSPWCFSVDDSKIDDHMYEREQLLP